MFGLIYEERLFSGNIFPSLLFETYIPSKVERADQRKGEYQEQVCPLITAHVRFATHDFCDGASVEKAGHSSGSFRCGRKAGRVSEHVLFSVSLITGHRIELAAGFDA